MLPRLDEGLPRKRAKSVSSNPPLRQTETIKKNITKQFDFITFMSNLSKRPFY
jgi:hypothetical protein